MADFKYLIISLFIGFVCAAGISLILKITLLQTIGLWLCMAGAQWSIEFTLKYLALYISEKGKSDQ